MQGTSSSAPAIARSSAPCFAHLHLHSEYSLLDGGNKIDRLLARVKALGMSAVAVTDHGNLFGAHEFYSKAKAAGIKPILGIEAYVAPDRDGKHGDRRDRTHTGAQDGGFHLVLLAEDLTGWKHLVKLSSDAYLQGFYYKPRMDKSTLTQWGEGIIAINGHLGSSIAFHLTQFVRAGAVHSGEALEHWQRAVEEAQWHASVFKPNAAGEPRFYIELQRHVPEQEEINPHLIALAEACGLPLVVDNDAHFLLREDHDVHDTLCCISMQKLKGEEGRLKYPEEIYVKSPEEMSALFPAPKEQEALLNAGRIAERCCVTLPKDEKHAPVVRVKHPGFSAHYDEGDLTEWFKGYCAKFEVLPFDATKDGDSKEALKESCDAALRDLCEAGLIWRYGAQGVTPQIRARLERELKVLADKLISAYFLIVWDFVNWARQRGIPATARGSGVGTMVGYVLGLSNACPETYGLLFERFADPDRAEYPDIDVDICQDGRASVIDYVRKKYGHVAQIITFGRLKARAAIKDVGRVMGLTPQESQGLVNLIPVELDVTIDEALEKSPEFAAAVQRDPRFARVIEHARGLEDHARSQGIHAAGVIIATRPLDEIIPLCRPTGGGEEAVTQWDGPTCEKVGLLKMDFLGLRTLSIIERCKEIIRATLPEGEIWRAVGLQVPVLRETTRNAAGVSEPIPHPLDLDRIPLADPRVFACFRRGDTNGIFQFESGGMKRLLVDMQPDRLEDLIAANALFRPGPMELIPTYTARKHAREATPELHEVVSRFTSETYGIMVYQEQVMQVLHHLGGIALREAYTVIKAISKKQQSVINGARANFILGAAERGLPNARADELFELILKFAGYGFNKSHSTGYAIISYQTAYLRTFFPSHYMSALLSFESQARKVEEWAVYLDDCRKLYFPDDAPTKRHLGVEVRPPDINLSAEDFNVVFANDEPVTAWTGHIRFGLKAIKGVGGAAMAAVIEAREKGGKFESLFDFCERVDGRSVHRSVLESLVKAGCFDSLHGVEARASLVASLESAMQGGAALARDRAGGQETFFGAFAEASNAQTTATIELRKVAAWPRMEALQHEKDALGFHVSGHPLDAWKDAMQAFTTGDLKRITECAQDTQVVCAGLISRTKLLRVKAGRDPGAQMMVISLTDQSGGIEAVLFPETFAKFATLIGQDRAVLIIGTVDRKRAEPNVLVDRVIPLEDASMHLATRLDIAFDVSSIPPNTPASVSLAETLQLAAGLLKQASSAPSGGGRAVEVLLHLDGQSRRTTLLSHRLKVVPRTELVSQLRALLGHANVHVRGGWIPPKKERKQWGGRRNKDDDEG
ncbi:MAG: DNA polymerase III subunit alpha [Phycisphaerales bacterium]|nr:DNA polymerase III subunit alpha [Phycisphaerales bacterium]